MPSNRPPSAKQFEKAVLAVVADRGTATACPSEVARAMDPKGWRQLMEPVRAAVARLQQRGQVDVYQHGKPVRLEEARGPIRLRSAGVKDVDHRREPHRYRIGPGEEGVLTVQPYKDELLPLWRFATPDQAKESAAAIWKKFLEYGRDEDFVGMDMARKYLQMGFTRSRRYANHPGGRKYAAGTRTELPRKTDREKAAAAEIFRKSWQRALKNRRYLVLRRRHESMTGA
ncbi:MAG TPA: DUF4385 family protein [Polyangia bacterium]